MMIPIPNLNSLRTPHQKWLRGNFIARVVLAPLAIWMIATSASGQLLGPSAAA